MAVPSARTGRTALLGAAAVAVAFSKSVAGDSTAFVAQAQRPSALMQSSRSIQNGRAAITETVQQPSQVPFSASCALVAAGCMAAASAAGSRRSKRAAQSKRKTFTVCQANADASECIKLAVYGKGGIGKSTTSCNISIALARRGKKVLQIGCDPKHDSTFTLTGFLIPTIIDTLQEKDYHYENVWPEDVIYKGYGGVDCVEAGGPPAGAGCGGYVVGETVKLLKELNAFYEYDVILFDVLGDVVCGGFAAPLNYADYCMIVTDNGFDALFAANRIGASVRCKARTHPLRLAGLIGNRTSKRDLIDKYVQSCPMPVLEVLPLIEDIRVSRVKGKTLFEMAEKEPSLKYVCDYYLNIADQILANPEGVVPQEVPDRELFSLLSDFYLTPGQANLDALDTPAEEELSEVSFV
eukprot:TRINITY_DN1351_c0_g1_i2.p2 TRINITY_DN1351_c0_g1~~TRINITY_DN1351_c0_g1_i2.p2  ORF type:complete len:410 (+),score=104.73 TRINITY_DN1351_c0_g1_i2:76-1305(+)